MLNISVIFIQTSPWWQLNVWFPMFTMSHSTLFATNAPKILFSMCFHPMKAPTVCRLFHSTHKLYYMGFSFYVRQAVFPTTSSLPLSVLFPCSLYFAWIYSSNIVKMDFSCWQNKAPALRTQRVFFFQSTNCCSDAKILFVWLFAVLFNAFFLLLLGMPKFESAQKSS